MHIKILDIYEDDLDRLHLAFQCECGDGTGEVMNRKTMFIGERRWDDLRLWLAQKQDQTENGKRRGGVPGDIQELIGKPVDTGELKQRYKPQLDEFNGRAAEAQRQIQGELDAAQRGERGYRGPEAPGAGNGGASGENN